MARDQENTSEADSEQADESELTQIEDVDKTSDEEDDDDLIEEEASGEVKPAEDQGQREPGDKEGSEVKAEGKEDGDKPPITEPDAGDKEPIKEPAAQPEPVPEKAATPDKVDDTAAQPTYEDWLRQRQEWQQKKISDLAEVNYKMSDELIATLDESPQEVLPRLMARVYVDAVEGAVNAIASFLPQAIQQAQVTTQRADADEATFFEAWPDLKSVDDHGVIHKLGVAYRQANPAASAEEFIQQVGAMAMISLKRLPTNEEGAGNKPVVDPVPRPFPSAAGGSAPRKVGDTEVTVNAFDAMTREFEQEDADF